MNNTWKPWPKCPADDCHETEDVMIMECAPGYTYMITGGVCGHWVTLHRRPDTDMTDEEQRMWAEYFRPTDVPRETSIAMERNAMTITHTDETRIIALANQKGGVGKTTTTVNLGAALAEFGRRVLVIDGDPQGNASTALGIDHHEGTPSLYEVLDGKPITEVMQVTPHSENLLCVPSTIALAGAEIELVGMVARDKRLHMAIAECYRDFDYILIDCQPSLGLLTVNALAAAKEVLIPIQCEYYALEGLGQLQNTIARVNKYLNPRVHISTVLLTMYTRTMLANQVADNVITHFPTQTLKTRIPRRVQISEAPSHGMPIVTYNRGSEGAMAYVEAARELAGRRTFHVKH